MDPRVLNDLEAGRNEIEKPEDTRDTSPGELQSIAELLNQDSDLWVFRRFGTLHLFNILTLQQRLANLQGKLEQLPDSRWSTDLVLDIKQTLKDYDDALAAQARLKGYRPPEQHVFKALRGWNVPRHREELDVHPDSGKSCIDDLASIVGVEKTWTRRFIDRHPKLCKWVEIDVQNRPGRKRLRSILIYSEESILRIETAFVHMSFCLVLLCPIVVLSYLESKTWKMVVLAASLVIVSVLTAGSAGFMNTTSKSSLGLVAGYAAILVVFLASNVGS